MDNNEYSPYVILSVCIPKLNIELWYCWSMVEEHKLKVFGNRVLRRIFGPKGDGVTGRWRKLHNEELHNLAKYNQNYQFEEDEVGGACGTNGGEEERI
jgi:hypothetical protein